MLERSNSRIFELILSKNISCVSPEIPLLFLSRYITTQMRHFLSLEEVSICALCSVCIHHHSPSYISSEATQQVLLVRAGERARVPASNLNLYDSTYTHERERDCATCEARQVKKEGRKEGRNGRALLPEGRQIGVIAMIERASGG